MEQTFNGEHLAHLVEANGDYRKQSVREHSRQTAQYASERLEKIGLAGTGYFTGLIHDLGKARDAFSIYLEDAVAGKNTHKVNHTFAAVKFIMKRYHSETADPYDRLVCEILAAAVGAHHGLWDIYDPEGVKTEDGLSHRINADDEEIGFEEVVENFFQEVAAEEEVDRLFSQALEEMKLMLKRILDSKHDFRPTEKRLLCGYLTRLITSALLEGDRRDTAEFMDGKKQERSHVDKAFWESQLAYMEKKLQEFPQDTQISKVRAEISDQCKNFAKRGSGIYRLTVNTGGGKTLASLRYALTHAMEAEKKRIIFIIPLLSVLDQNSKEIRDKLRPETTILEHHSNIIDADDAKDEQEREELDKDKRELLTETWDAPVIISTLVQLLHILFSEKTTAVRRMQSLCNSVIVIDEIQSLPLKFSQIFTAQLNFLAEFCGTTIVLCSATQPAFERLKWPMRFAQPADMVIQNEQMREVFKRTEIKNLIAPHGMSLDELADFAAEQIETKDSLLIVCNTKETARQLYRKLDLQKDNGCEVYHLSTSMCGKHREKVLEAIGQTPGLREDRKVICVATQLVEAGIDFSFHCVIRIYAGIENIVQAAGRCNRSNEWGKPCEVFIVKLKGENLGLLKVIKEAQDCCRLLLNCSDAQTDLTSEERIAAYYKKLYSGQFFQEQVAFNTDVNGRMLSVLDMLANNGDPRTGKFFMRQAFKTAGTVCNKVFDDEKTDVIVPYDGTAKEVIANLTSAKGIQDIAYMKAQLALLRPYTVSLFEHEIQGLRRDQRIDESRFSGVIFLDKSAYNDAFGVSVGEYKVDEDILLG